jgi:large subunit ribosomal protein L24
MTLKFKVKKGDRVAILSGKDKGKTGEILKMIPDVRRAIVQGVNMVKRHTAPSQAGAGGVVEKEASIHVSNISLIDPKDDRATRVGFKSLEHGRKVRYAKKSGEIIDV